MNYHEDAYRKLTHFSDNAESDSVLAHYRSTLLDIANSFLRVWLSSDPDLEKYDTSFIAKYCFELAKGTQVLAANTEFQGNEDKQYLKDSLKRNGETLYKIAQLVWTDGKAEEAFLLDDLVHAVSEALTDRRKR